MGGRTSPSRAYPTLFPETTCTLLGSLLGTPDSLVLPSEEGLVPVTGPRTQEHRRPPAKPSWGHMRRSHAPPMGTQPDSLGPRPVGGVSKAGGLLSCLQSTSCDRGPSQWVRAGSSLQESPPSAKVSVPRAHSFPAACLQCSR